MSLMPGEALSSCCPSQLPSEACECTCMHLRRSNDRATVSFHGLGSVCPSDHSQFPGRRLALASWPHSAPLLVSITLLCLDTSPDVHFVFACGPCRCWCRVWLERACCPCFRIWYLLPCPGTHSRAPWCLLKLTHLLSCCSTSGAVQSWEARGRCAQQCWVIGPDLIEQIWFFLSNFQQYYPNNPY